MSEPWRRTVALGVLGALFGFLPCGCDTHAFVKVGEVRARSEVVRRVQAVPGPDTGPVVFSSSKGMLTRGNWRTGEIHWRLRAEGDFTIKAFAVSPDGRRIAVLEVGPFGRIELEREVGPPQQPAGEQAAEPGAPDGREGQRYPWDVDILLDRAAADGLSTFLLAPSRVRVVDFGTGREISVLRGREVIDQWEGQRMTWADSDRSIVISDSLPGWRYSRVWSMDAESGAVKWVRVPPWSHLMGIELVEHNRLLVNTLLGFVLYEADTGDLILGTRPRVSYDAAGLSRDASYVYGIIEFTLGAGDTREESTAQAEPGACWAFLEIPIDEAVRKKEGGGAWLADIPQNWDYPKKLAISPDKRFLAVLASKEDSPDVVHIYDITHRGNEQFVQTIRFVRDFCWTAAGELLLAQGDSLTAWRERAPAGR